MERKSADASKSSDWRALEQGESTGEVRRCSPGKMTRTARVRLFRSVTEPVAQVQLKAHSAVDDDAADMRETAAAGLQGSSESLPFQSQIAASFGPFADALRDVRVHVDRTGQAAAQEIGARAYTSDNHIVFAEQPDLYTAAHEAAHVVQQRGGVQLGDGVGRPGDAHERNADAVAERVVAGESAQDLLAVYASGSPASGLQLDGDDHAPLQNRQLRHEFQIVDDYDSFRSAVQAWMATQVMSRTETPEAGGPVRRERGLVSRSNLRRLHQRARSNGMIGETVTLIAELQAGNYRYYSVQFRIAGAVLLDPVDVEGDPVDRPAVRAQIRRFEQRRLLMVERLRQRIERAADLAQHAVMEGSQRYRPNEYSERYEDIMEVMTAFDRMTDGDAPGSQSIANYHQSLVRRELEQMTDAAIERADQAAAEVRKLDRDLTRLHRELGEEYHQPGTTPGVPRIRR